MGPIKRLQGVIIRTPKFPESVDYYVKGFGLTLVSDDGKRAVFDGARGCAGVLEIIAGEEAGLVGLTFAMPDADALRTSKVELAAKGYAASDRAEGGGAFSVISPDGQVIAFVTDAGAPDAESTADGLPLFVSHTVINSLDAPRLTSFFVDVLGFRVADRYERDLLTFLKVDQPQHHCVGVSPGESSSLNHFSLDVGSIDGLMRSVGRMQKAGYTPIWGPGRHGPGGNVFCYFEDPTGFVAEFTCDVLQIEDEKTWVPKEWPRVPDTANVWGTGGPSLRAVALMSGNH